MADIPLSVLEFALSSIQSIRLSELACSTIIVFDHLITLDREISLIWNAPWSPGVFLFIINRYYSLAIVISFYSSSYRFFVREKCSPILITFVDQFHLSCLHWLKWQGWSGVALCMITEVILQLRLFALYYLNTKVLLLMVGFFLAAMATSATLMGTFLSGITARAHDIPGTPFCVAYHNSRHFYAFWVPILCFETFLCGLAVFRGLQNFTSQSTLFLSGKRVFEVLVRDSVLYFLIMFATYLVNLLLFLKEPDTLIQIPICFIVAMSCVMGNRLLLNTREVVQETDLHEKPSFVDPRGGFPLHVMGTGSSRDLLSNHETDQLWTMQAVGTAV